MSTAGPAEREDGYRLILRAVADPGKEPQTFETVSSGGSSVANSWSKHVRFHFTSHYGMFEAPLPPPPPRTGDTASPRAWASRRRRRTALSRAPPWSEARGAWTSP